jgi:hypothetical protein
MMDYGDEIQQYVDRLILSDLDVRKIIDLGRLAIETIPSSTLPIDQDAEIRTFRNRWQVDGEVEEQIDRRMRQGRKFVFSMCCRILNPLEFLPDTHTRAAYKMNEIIQRFKIATDGNVSICGYEDGIQFVLSSGGGRIVSQLSPGACFNASERKTFCEHTVVLQPTLFVGVDGGIGDFEDLVMGRTFLAQFVLAIRCLAVGGTCVLQLFAPISYPLVEGVLAMCLRGFTGTVSLCKPLASLPGTAERFLVAVGWKGPNSPDLGKKMKPADLEVWLERSAMEHVNGMFDEELNVPFLTPRNFSTGLDLACRLLVIERQKVTKKALELCKIIVSHRPMARREQLLALSEACYKNVSVQHMASKYTKKYPIASEPNTLLATLGDILADMPSSI